MSAKINRIAIGFALLTTTIGAFEAKADEVTLKGSVVCHGATIPDPKKQDHGLVIFAVDGTPQIQAVVNEIVQQFYPDKGLDTVAAQKLMDQFSARLKYFIDPASPALKDAKNQGDNHYCMPATASAVTGTILEKDGQRWITATRIEPVQLKYPDKLLTADKPFVMPSKDPLILKVGKDHTLRCVHIPAGTFLMGTPVYMWPYHVEEFPHPVTLTNDYYMAEIPVTQAMFEDAMGTNPSLVKDPDLPVQNPTFADLKIFCDRLSEANASNVRLPTSAEWEYAARVGTSNPGFSEKYKDQNSSGSEGYRSPLKVKSKQPNAWGLYDMASCWWEITGDRGMYHVRHSVTNPHYPPGIETARSQRTGRGIVSDRWSICTHEFITEKADYAGQKFRVVVEISKD
jgi:formylglycine-generating enzyme required for sulfatase activity